jgi:hypothetical protein
MKQAFCRKVRKALLARGVNTGTTVNDHLKGNKGERMVLTHNNAESILKGDPFRGRKRKAIAWKKEKDREKT